MPSFEPVRFGLIGGGWITEQHIAAIRSIPEAEVVAIADYPRDRRGASGRAAALSRAQDIGHYFEDYRRMLEDRSIEAVTVSLPNRCHAEVALAALSAGKHVVVEKPLCFSLADADRLVALARASGLVCAYAEELCYCPKFVAAKKLVDEGGIGDLWYVKQIEAHEGPYSEWFFDPELAGGGVLLDLGCHSIEFARWMLNKAPIRRVTAHLSQYLHGDHGHAAGPLEDHAVLHLEFLGGATALLEASWVLRGGMDSVSRLIGSRGVLDVDLLKGSGMKLFSVDGLLGKALPGWSTPDFEWLHQNGYPQEFADFARAIRLGRAPLETAEDGRVVLEVMWAAYVSAAEGRTVDLPFVPDPKLRFPAEPWLLRERAPRRS